MMEIRTIQVWVAPVEDTPGGLARVLTPIAAAGAELEFIAARRDAGHAGRSVVFIAPLEDETHINAARHAGFEPSQLGMLRLAGFDAPGIATALSQELLAAEQISLRGASAVAIHHRCVAYLAFDSVEEAERALAVLEDSEL